MIIPCFGGFDVAAALAVPTYISGPGGSSVSSIVLTGAPVAIGDLCIAVGGNSSTSSRTPTAPLADALGESKAGTSCFGVIGVTVLTSDTQTLTFSGIVQRFRTGIWRGSSRLSDYQVSVGTGTSATQGALTTDDVNCACWDFVYTPTATITIGDPSNLTNISGNTSGASWRSARTADGVGVGVVGTFTPGAVSLSSSVNWVRISAIVSPVP